MLGGAVVPMDTARQIPVDSYTPGQGVSTITPISSSSDLPEKKGEDTIYVFLDTNTSDYFGFEVNDTFHADKLIEINGQNGLINSAKLHNFLGNDSFDWSWEFIEDVAAAAYGNELEMSISKIDDTFKAYYHLISWDTSEDFSDGFWVVDQFGSRTTPTWTEHTIKSNYDAAWDVYAIDLDQDGDMDILGAAAGTSEDISWWENDGSESFTKRTISGSYRGADSVFAMDLDKDGDIDVLSTAAASNGDEVTWWENDGTPSNGGWTERTIDSDFQEAWYVRAADIDEDGDIDVVAAGKGAGGTNGKIKWYQNDGAADPSWTAVLIDSNIDGAMCVRAVDIDGDGDLDVLGAAEGPGDLIAWWENDGTPSGAGWTQNNIETSFDEAHSVYGVDLDRDGDMDVIGTAGGNDDEISWWENDGSESFTKNVIDTTYNGAWGIYPKDIDLDGDIDILSTATTADDLTWWENDGSQNFDENVIKGDFDGARNVYAADVDTDGDIDILAVANIDDDITWWENTATFSFDPSWTASDIDTNADGAYAIFAADMDNDGDMDIVSASYTDDTIAWYENNGAANPSWSAANIATNVDGAIDIHVTDLDSDGDLDIVSVSDNDEIIAWFENDGATDPSWSKSTIDTRDDEWPSAVYAGDMDNDGDIDIVVASYNDDTISWYENDGASDPSWSYGSIATSADGAYDVFVIDMDNDGDLDILSAARIDDTIALYTNDGASDPSWSATDITTSADGATSVFAADMDNDGDIDILSASKDDDTIAWYENAGGFWPASAITTSADYAEAVFAADMDNDGDMDIISASANDDTIAWYENNGASDPSWTASDIATSADYATAIFVADMDNDGDLDIISASWNDDTIAWYENTAIPEFSNILMPIVSVLAIVALNYRRRRFIRS